MRADDAPAVAALTTQLGYPVDAVEMLRRAQPIMDRDDHVLLVAIDEADRPIAWLHVLRHATLEGPESALIAGLVVDEDARSVGTGTALLSAGEAWARGHALDTMLVRSRSSRTRAHRFYERMGFVETKRSHVFEKSLV